jgi:hypothetical protein
MNHGGPMLDFLITMKVKLSKSEQLKIIKSERLLELVVNSPEFKEEILKADFHGETSLWKNRANIEIYKHIMSGQETLRPEIDGVANVDLSVFNPNWKNKNVVGYTYMHVLTQWINRTYLRTRHYLYIASNILHEWGHKLGFQHDHKRTARRPFSICYQLNVILKKLSPKFIEQVNREFNEVNADIGLPVEPERKPRRSRWGFLKFWRWFR